MTHKLFLVTTETSGDLLAGELLRELHQDMTGLTVRGVGGDRCLEQGMDCIYQVRDFNVMGLVEVLSQLRRLKRMFNELVAAIKADKPDVVVLVDAPDFNLRFAAAIRELGVPVVYYVSPQVWAWRQGRAKKISEIVDHMMVLFAFEEEIYKPYGLPTTWVGHPLVDELSALRPDPDFRKQHGLPDDKPLVALAPGSRNSVVGKLLPVMRDVALARADQYAFAMPLAGTVNQSMVDTILLDAPVTVIRDGMRPLMQAADAAVVASGTATLETALLRTPLVVGYRLKRLSYWLATRMVKLPHVALVNIVLDKGVAPELIQADFNPEAILPLLDQMVTDPSTRTQMIEEFDRLEQILGGGGAAARAARVVQGFFH